MVRRTNAGLPRRGAVRSPAMLNERQTWMLVMKLSASPARNWTSGGVTMTECGWFVTG